MVELARGSALDALAVSKQLIEGAQKLAERVARRLKLEAEREEQLELAGDVEVIDPLTGEVTRKPPNLPSVGSAINNLSRVVDIMGRINDLAHKAMVMERLYLGEPSEIVEHRGNIEFSLSEAQLRVEAAKQAIQLAELAERNDNVIDVPLIGLPVE